MTKVTLTKSLIGAKPNQKATAASLGLKIPAAEIRPSSITTAPS